VKIGMLFAPAADPGDFFALITFTDYLRQGILNGIPSKNSLIHPGYASFPSGATERPLVLKIVEISRKLKISAERSFVEALLITMDLLKIFTKTTSKQSTGFNRYGSIEHINMLKIQRHI
jgi:hypothetical protein